MAPSKHNEHWRIGVALLEYMHKTNEPLAKTAAGKGLLVQMEKALRGAESITLSATEGARWGLPRGIVVNGRIKNDFGYPHGPT